MRPCAHNGSASHKRGRARSFIAAPHPKSRARRPVSALQVLRHEHAAGAGGIASNLSKPPPSVPLVEAGGLKADRIEEGRTTATPPPFDFKEPENFRAQAGAAECERQVEQVEEQQP